MVGAVAVRKKIVLPTGVKSGSAKGKVPVEKGGKIVDITAVLKKMAAGKLQAPNSAKKADLLRLAVNGGKAIGGCSPRQCSCVDRAPQPRKPRY